MLQRRRKTLSLFRIVYPETTIFNKTCDLINNK